MSGVIERSGCELEIINGKKRVFFMIYFNPQEIWIDISVLPQSAFLCAVCDGTPLMEARMGEKKKAKKTLVNIEWALNEWGVDGLIKESLLKAKEHVLKQMPTLRKKYDQM